MPFPINLVRWLMNLTYIGVTGGIFFSKHRLKIASCQSVDLVPITPANYELAKGLAVRPDQEDLVASLQKSLADAYVYSEALFRLAFSGEALVGYLLVFPYDSDKGCIGLPL